MEGAIFDLHPKRVAVEPDGTVEVRDGEKNVMHPGNGSG